MKLSIYKYIIFSFLIAALFSCNKVERPPLDYDEGYLSLSFGQQEGENIVVKSEEVVDPIFAVSIADSASGVIVKKTNDHHEFETQPLKLKVGKYIITASNGESVEAGFDKPFYSGKDTVTIVAGKQVSSSIVCTLSNVKVSLKFSEAVKKAFPKIVAVITNNNELGNLIYSEELGTINKSGYFKCSGTINWEVSLTNKNGVTYKVSNLISPVNPREHYILNFNVDESGSSNTGGSQINISYDPSTNYKEYSCTISLSKKPAPTVEGEGFDIASPLTVPYQSALFGALNINSQAGIRKLSISHNSQVLLGSGIPYSFNIEEISDYLKMTINNAGISWSDFKIGNNRVVVDFKTLLSKLPLGEYLFNIDIIDNQSQYVRVPFTIKVIPDVEVSTLSVDPWAKFAYVTAQWNTVTRPEGIGFEYKKSSDAAWTKTSGSYTEDGVKYSFKITSLEPNTQYQCRAISAAENSNIISFTTETVAQLPNMSFDNWFKSGKNWYPDADLTAANFIWDSGNAGANTLSEINPTAPEENLLAVSGSGKKAAKLVSSSVLGVLAGGNVYSGYFVERSGTNAKISFGRPYTSRPTALKGYYNYAPVAIDKTKDPYTNLAGQMDKCHIFVMLTDWDSPYVVDTGKKNFINPETEPGIIAYGELVEESNTNGYKEFTINLVYRNDKKPKHCVVVATASKYADFFTGGVGSKLYVDEFQFSFE